MNPKIQDARENLLLHGKRILLEKGYGGLTIAELSKACGMSVATFYHYFENKDALILQIVTDDWDLLLAKVEDSVSLQTTRYDSVHLLYDLIVAFEHEYRFFATSTIYKSESLLRNERENLRKLYDLVARKLEEKIAAGILVLSVNPEIAGCVIVQSCVAAGRNPDISFDDFWNCLHVLAVSVEATGSAGAEGSGAAGEQLTGAAGKGSTGVAGEQVVASADRETLGAVGGEAPSPTDREALDAVGEESEAQPASHADAVPDSHPVSDTGATATVQQLRELEKLNAELIERVDNREHLMDISEVAIIKIDLSDFSFLEYNDAMCRMLGLTREEYEQRYQHRMELFFTGEYADDLETLKQTAIDAMKAGERSFTLNMRVPEHNGVKRVGGAASFADFDPETGEPGVLYAVYRDITELLETQERLAQAEVEAERATFLDARNHELQNLIDGVPCGLSALRIVYGTMGRLQMNRFFRERVDVDALEDNSIELSRFLDCLHPDDRARCANDFHQFLERKFPMVVQYRFRRRYTGEYFWVSTRASYVYHDEYCDRIYIVYSDIDRMKNTQSELKESRELYKSTIDALQIALWTYDIPARRITLGDNAATTALQRKHGWPQVFENVPESILPTIEDEDREAYRDMFRRIDAGQDASCEVWYKQHLGAEPHCERETYHVVCDEVGKPVMAYGIGQNITAEKKVKERYEREMNYLRDNSDESLIAKGRYNLTQNRVLEYESQIGNRQIYTFKAGIPYDTAFEGMLAAASNEAERATIDDRLRRENLIRRYQQGDMQTTLQYSRYVEGQDAIWISMTVHTYMRPDNGDLELFSYAYDVTERKLNEIVMDLIAEDEFDYVSLLYANEDTFEFLKKSARIAEPEVRVRTSYSEDIAYIRSHFLNEEDGRMFDEAVSLERVLPILEENGRYTSTYLMRDGERTRCCKIDYTWFDRERGVILTVGSDVTVAYEREQDQLRKLDAARLEAERANDAKSVFLSSMSHDMRTPLNGVIGYTDFALREDDLDRMREYLKKIDASGRLLLDLVNDTLELSRIESGKVTLEPEVVVPGDFVLDVVTALKPYAELEDVQLDVDVSAVSRSAVYCDRRKMQKVALNLISNSIKYTHAGGKVQVTLQPVASEGPGYRCNLIIEDDGIGMSEGFMQRMYEPFSQEKRSEAVKTPGTGLGLSIVKRYVDLLGGTIDVESHLHEGTRWTITLPLLPTDGQEERQQEVADSGTSLEGKHVLLCEDNEMNTEIAVMLLDDKGMHVDCAADGEMAVDVFSKSAEGYYDAVLMDIRMPHMNGYEATKAIRKLDREDARTVPVIAMTADVFEESMREATESGMDDYVTKPIDPQKFFGTLQKRLVR